jgi:hypothetical protein
MLIVDVSEVELPGEAKQNNLPLECGKPIFFYWGKYVVRIRKQPIDLSIPYDSTHCTMRTESISLIHSRPYWYSISPFRASNYS